MELCGSQPNTKFNVFHYEVFIQIYLSPFERKPRFSSTVTFQNKISCNIKWHIKVKQHTKFHQSHDEHFVPDPLLKPNSF